MRPKNCAVCGTEFIPKDECISRSRKFCSRECTWAHQKQKAVEKYPPAEDLERMHHEDEMTVAEIARHYRRSDEWIRNAMTARGVRFVNQRWGKDRECQNCGETYYARKSELRAGRKYCSAKCKAEGQVGHDWMSQEARQKLSRERRGPKNPMWRGGSSVERASKSLFSLKKKGDRICRNCGTEENIHLHHAIPRSMYRDGRNELLNGVPLCQTCHYGWHHRRVVLHRSIFKPEEWEYISGVNLLGQNTTAWLDDRYPE